MKKSEEIALDKQIRSQFAFDRLQMLFCMDYHTKGGITVRQPRIGEILEIGEENFYRNLNVWVTNTTSYRAYLWSMGEDWCKHTDYELFCSLYKAIDPEIMSLVFPDLDMSKFEQSYRVIYHEEEDMEDEYELVLYSKELDEVIDKMAYLEISQYLRTLFNIFPRDEFAKGRATKEALIWEDEEKARKNKDDGFESSLFPLVSTMINYPGFKHSLADLRNVGIFEFMDSVNRSQVIENARAMIMGSTTGMADMSKVPKENFNMARDIYVSDKKDKPDNDAFKSVTDNYSMK